MGCERFFHEFFRGKHKQTNWVPLNTFTDLSLALINKGTNSRLRWTKYSDLYEIVHPSLVLISLCLHTGA